MVDHVLLAPNGREMWATSNAEGRLYVYDAENRAFVNEVDYYGKRISNVVKFINDGVLVMMTISGSKVDLNVYQKNAEQ